MIYCFDLDGTLCDTEGSDYPGALPNHERIDAVNKLYDEGNTIWIDSARGSTSGEDWNSFTKNQIEGWGINFHKVRTGIKFNADIFVDDKAIFDKNFFKET